MTPSFTLQLYTTLAPSPVYVADELVEFLVDSCERLLSQVPTAKIIIAGDINQLDIRDLLYQLSLAQIVKVPALGDSIRDVFITNAPHLW